MGNTFECQGLLIYWACIEFFCWILFCCQQLFSFIFFRGLAIRKENWVVYGSDLGSEYKNSYLDNLMRICSLLY